MVTVTMYRGETGLYEGYTISGHADGGGSGEYDLICAAVSGITLTAAMGLQDVLHKEGTYDSSSGFMNVRLTSSPDGESEILMKTMVHGLEAIREHYPGHLTLRIKG